MIKLNLLSLILLLSLSFKSLAMEFITGNYELVKGDEKFCEDGFIQIKKDDLLLGTRYRFPNFKSKDFQYSNDDKTCEYKISNFNEKDFYKQKLIQTCKKEVEPLNREIIFKYKNKNELEISIQLNNQSYQCLLRYEK